MSGVTATCPHCGHSLAVMLADPALFEEPLFEAGGAGGLPLARPRPVYRGHGEERMKAWGAVADKPLEPGARVQVVTRSGKTWTATVAEALGAADRGGFLVSLRGAEWSPDPDVDVDADGRHPNDPDWLHD